MKVTTRHELLQEAQNALEQYVSEYFDFEGLFFWPIYDIPLEEYFPKEFLDKIIDRDKFEKTLIKYSKLYKEYYSIYRDDYPNLYCDFIKIQQEIYYWRAKWIYNGLAKWDFYSNSHYIINDLAVQLYTNIQSVEEFKDLWKKYYTGIEKRIQIKNFSMLVELENLINYQLVHDNTESN